MFESKKPGACAGLFLRSQETSFRDARAARKRRCRMSWCRCGRMSPAGGGGGGGHACRVGMAGADKGPVFRLPDAVDGLKHSPACRRVARGSLGRARQGNVPRAEVGGFVRGPGGRGTALRAECALEAWRRSGSFSGKKGALMFPGVQRPCLPPGQGASDTSLHLARSRRIAARIGAPFCRTEAGLPL